MPRGRPPELMRVVQHAAAAARAARRALPSAPPLASLGAAEIDAFSSNVRAACETLQRLHTDIESLADAPAADAALHGVAELLFRGPEFKKCLLQQLAIEAGGSSRDTFRERCALLAGYAVLLMQSMQLTITNTFVDISSRPATRFRFLHHVEVAMYDETPLIMRGTGQRCDVFGSGDNGIAPLDGGVAGAFGAALARPGDRTTEKVLQTRTWAFELLSKATIAGSSGAKLVVASEQRNPLQRLRSQHIPAFVTALKECGGFYQTLRAEQIDRVAVVDRHKSCAGAERVLQQERRTSARSRIEQCRIHITASAHRKACVALNAAISAMIQFSKCFDTSGSMSLYRSCMYDVIVDRCVIIVGFPPPCYEHHRQQVVRWFVAGRGRALRQAVLRLLPQGDWTNRSCVEVWIPPRTAFVPEDVKRVAARNLVRALVPHRPRMYERQTWHGQEEAISDIAIQDQVHGLLLPTFQRFCQRRAHPGGSVRAAQPLGGGDAAMGGDASTVMGIVASVGGEADDALPSAAPYHEEEDARAALAKQQREALRWMTSRSPSMSTQLILMRTVIAPLQEMLRKQRWVSSVPWERQQACSAARGARLPSGLTRDFRVLVAARGTHEDECLVRLAALMCNPLLWKLVDGADRTVRTRGLAFTMISKAAAYTERHLAALHRRPQTQLFLLLEDVELARHVYAMPSCLLGLWAADFCARNPADSLDTKIMLMLLAHASHTTTMLVEAGHAHARRVVKSRVQCKQVGFADLSAVWVGMQVKRDQSSESFGDVEAGAGRGGEGSDDADPMQRQGKRGGGGAYRAFVHEQRSSNFAEVNAKWRSIQGRPDEMRRLSAAGEVARKKHRDGARSFGPRQRDVLRQHEKRLRVAEASALVAADGHDPLPELVNRAIDDEAKPSQLVAMIREVQSALNKKEADRQRDECQAIATYAAENTDRLVAQLVEVAPGLRHVASCMRAVPFCGDVGMLCLHAPTVSHKALACASYVQQRAPRRGSTRTINVAVKKHWEHRTRLIGPTEGDDLADDALAMAAPRESKCFLAGHCICSVEGKLLHKLVVNFLRAFKAVFIKANAQLRENLASGMVAVRLSGCRLGASEDERELWGVGERFLHVSDMSWNPYAPIFQELAHVADDELAYCNGSDDELSLKALGHGVRASMRRGGVVGGVHNARGSRELTSQWVRKMPSAICKRGWCTMV